MPQFVPDVFERLHELGSPQHVYICGAGPNGRAAYDKIPADAYTMACNCLIEYPRTWTLWCAIDGFAREMSWWSAPVPRETKVLLSHGLVPYHENVDYSCDVKWTVGQDWYPMKSIMFNGATVVGVLTQLAFFMGVKHITYVGVDMKGSKHYDGSYAYPYPGPWHQLHRLSAIVKFLKKKIRFDSLTPTLLAIPVVADNKEHL